jgi:PAS domain S-box-containing protein
MTASGGGGKKLTHPADRAAAVTSGEVLRRSEANLRALIDSSPDAVCVHRDGLIVFVNPAMLAILGYDNLDDLIGYPVHEKIVHPGDLPFVIQRMDALRKDPSSSVPVADVRWVRKDGSVIHVESRVVSLVFDGFRAQVVIARDVTERRRLQEQLVISDRLASVGTLAAGVAHEINNPLAAIIANLSLICDEIGPNPTPAMLRSVVEMATDARNAAERIRNIVRGLKTFSRPEEDRRTVLDVRSVLEQSINVVYNEIRHRARLVKDYAPIPSVVADEGRLGQVFTNLLVNAAQAIADGHSQQHEIRVITSTTPEGHASIEVRDTGKGMAPDVLARVFEPFYTTKAVGVGSGLGLSICHGLVTALGGTITIASEVGRGTTVRVVLPAAVQAQSLAEEPEPASAPAAGGKVLVIDDDEGVLKSLTRLLSRKHEVVSLLRATDAVPLFEAGHAFDIVLCDLMMPEMNGMELHALVSTRFPEAAGRLVFVTGGAFTPSTQAFLDAVPNERLEKPVDAQNLRALVARYVARK